MYCRGIRGATTVETNTAEEILEATKELLVMMVEANDVKVEDVASAIFTTTTDLNADFPAKAARVMLGWKDAALSCYHELDVPGSLRKCIRILLLINTAKRADEINHIYIKGAKNLRAIPSSDQ